MLKIFESKLYQPSDGSLRDLSLLSAFSVGKQMLVIYRNSTVPDQFWPSDCWPTPWPNEIKVKRLKKYLETSLTYRSPDIGYVTQCVLTPPVKFIIPR